MSELLDAEAWLDEQLAAETPPQQDIAVLPDRPGTSPLISASAPVDPTKTSLYDMAPSEAPAGGNAILYPRFTDLTLPQTPRGPVPEDPMEANRQANAAAFGDERMDAEAWLDNAVATTPTPRSVKLPSGISSYGNDYLKTIDTSKLTPEEFLSINPDVEVVRGMLHNPQYKPTFEEWQDLTAIEQRLVEEGKIEKPGNLEMVGNAVGGLIVLASDFIYNTAIDADGSITRPGETIDRMKEGTWRVAPAETLARSPATMLSAGKLAGATMQYIGQMIEADWNERPQYVVNETGEMLASSSQLRLPNAEVLSKQYAARGQTIRPVTEQELQKFDYERFLKRRETQKLEDDALNNTTAPTEFVTMLLTGRNQMEKPIQSQAQGLSMAGDPMAIIPFGSATSRWGLSAFGKKASAKMLGGLEKVSGGLVRANDAMFDRFSKTVSDQTGVELTTWQKGIQEAKKLAPGVAVSGGVGGAASAFGVDPAISGGIASSYLAYKLGLGVLRRVETGSRLGKTILRESADATNGLDQAARLAVAANPAVPGVIREALERPTQFIPIESTPARIASNPAFGPTTRAVADRLSNPFVVQAVRNTAALAKGSAKGAIANSPFAYLEANAGNEEGAAGAIGAGLAFGTAGAAFERVGGLRDRRVRQAVGDIGRMLVDVELAGGDVNHLVKTRDMQGLADLAALQGYYRNGFEFVPLNNADYTANKRANGQKDLVSPNKQGTAGYFLQVPAGGGKPIIYINLDATNRNPLPHEIGHLITAGGLENPQKISARAWVEKTYGPDGIKARGEEYARTLIQARADAAARAEGKEPSPIDITPDMLAAEMESLGQDGLVRGDLDTMDWARDEIFAETFATNSAAMDWASIRRGNPAGGNFLTFAEGILGAQARGLMAAGVRIDPQTGRPLDTQASLFKQNPVLAADPQVMKQLETYSKNFNAYLLNPDQTKPRGARIAPSGRVQDLVNTGLVKNHANDKGGAENLWTVTDANGVTRPKSQAELNAEQKLRAEQAGNLFQTKKLSSPADPTVSRKKRTNGNIETFGRRLPQNFFFSNSFGRHIRDFARLFEEAMDNGETLNTSYFAVLTKSSDTGAVRDKDLGNAVRIDREVMPFEWFVSSQNNILASVLDITKFRNRVNRAIRDGDEPIARLFDNKWENIEPAFKKLLDNHRNNLPGETGLGAETRDVLNALIGIATNENKARNPYSGRYGKDSAIERFRLDRINDSVKSGRTSFHFDYSKAAGNALPEIATPLPDLSRDLPPAQGQAMPDVFEVEAFHGTPDGNFTEFRDAPGGIFFSNKRSVAEGYTYKRGAWLSKGKNPSVISSKLRMENPLVIDAMGARYNNIPFPGREYKRTTFGNIPQDAVSVEDAAQLAFQAGHDGIVIKNVMDGSTTDDKIRSTVYAVRSPSQIARSTPQGQAMPDVVHGGKYILPKQVPLRGYFIVGTKPTTDGRVLEYHVDPTTVIQPKVAGIDSIRGEQVAMLEADRHNTRGDNMGGPLHPFLISNQTVARLPDGRGYKAVWANMNSAFVTRAKNIVKNTTAGHALIQIMKENAHRSNRKFVMDVTAEIDKRSASMSKDQTDFLHVLLELGAINPKSRINQAAGKLERTAKAALSKEVPMQELAEAQKDYDATLQKYQPMVEFLSRLSPMKSHATRGRMDAFDSEFATLLSKYKKQPWFESMASKYRNTKFVDEAARFSFNQRGAAMDRITGIPFAPDVKAMLKNSMDFVNGQNLDVVGVVQLSKDADAFAVYFGKNPKEEAKMSANERLLRDQLLASGSFKPHPSYDWVMLGPENADSFILDKPADPLKLFPDYAKNHPNKNVRKGSKETVVGTMKKSKIPLVLK